MRPRFPWFMVLIVFFFVTTIHIGDILYEEDKELGMQRNIYEYTERTFNWNSSLAPIREVNDSMNITDTSPIRVNNILNKGVDWFGFTFFEVGKLGVEIGYFGNGSYNLAGMLTAIKWLIYIVIGYYLLMPIAAIIIICLHSYDWIKKKLIERVTKNGK